MTQYRIVKMEGLIWGDQQNVRIYRDSWSLPDVSSLSPPLFLLSLILVNVHENVCAEYLRCVFLSRCWKCLMNKTQVSSLHFPKHLQTEGILEIWSFHYSFEKKKVCKCQIHCIWPGFSFRPHFLSPCPAFLTVLVKQIQNCSIRGRLTESMYWLPFLTAVFHGLDTLTVMGIAFAAFVIGALLTGALWYIYSHTGECDRRVLAGVWPVCAPHSRHFRVSLHGWVDGITTNKRERSFPQFAHGRNWHQLGFAKI